jgi:hypothetical protein
MDTAVVGMARRTVLRGGLWLSLLAAPLVAHADQRGDMVAFDQAYIPALVLSGELRPQTDAAMGTLLRRWDEFKQQQAYRRDRDPDWNFDIARIERHILDAQRLVEERSYLDAHKALEPVREILMAMRRRIGMNYFLDALWRFQVPMAAMQRHLAALQATGDEQEQQAVAESYDRARARWEAVLDQAVNPYEYGLDVGQGRHLRQQLLAEQGLLRAFGQALARDDLQAMADTAARILSGFVACYSELGRFPETS